MATPKNLFFNYYVKDNKMIDRSDYIFNIYIYIHAFPHTHICIYVYIYKCVCVYI